MENEQSERPLEKVQEITSLPEYDTATSTGVKHQKNWQDG
jgi:hypothetical protein